MPEKNPFTSEKIFTGKRLNMENGSIVKLPLCGICATLNFVENRLRKLRSCVTSVEGIFFNKDEQ
jgi:hypothetical protein